MSTLREGRRTAEFILSEENGNVSRQSGVVAAGLRLPAGQVVEKNDDDELIAYTADETTAAGILIYPVDSRGGAVAATYLARKARVALDDLTYPADEAATTAASLGDLGIIVSPLPLSVGEGGGGGDYLGPLDLVAGAVAAYSQRAMAAAWVSNAITVRRDSDDATQSFATASSNAVDPAAIAAFIGAGTGFIAAVKDQSGNSFNLTNDTAADQAEWIADAIGGKPGAGNYQTVILGSLADEGGLSLIHGQATVFIVGKLVDFTFYALAPDFPYISMTTGSGDRATLDLYDGSSEAGGKFSNAAADAFHIWEGRWEFGASRLKLDGATIAKTTDWDSGSAIADFQSFFATIGCDDSENLDKAGFCELVYYGSLLSDADCTAIRQNIAAYYGITLS